MSQSLQRVIQLLKVFCNVYLYYLNVFPELLKAVGDVVKEAAVDAEEDVKSPDSKKGWL